MNEPVLRKVARAIRRHSMLGADEPVLVAVSGGPDSVALLAALIELGNGRRRVGIAHVNHHLRGRDSDRDQAFVAGLSSRFGCKLYAIDARIPGRANLEERAREARYRALLGIAAREGFRAIATGHTLDDQAETVLHRLIRGAGIGGLGGIRPKRADGVIRPLLEVSRAEVVAYLRKRGLRFRVDRSNTVGRFTRNRIRRQLLPLLERDFNPAIRAALARLADLSRDDEALLEGLAERRARGGAAPGLECARLRRTPTALQRRVIRRWLAAARGGLRAIELHHVERLRDLAADHGEGKSVSLPGGAVTRSRGLLHWNLRAPRFPGVALSVPRGETASVPGWQVRTRTSRRPARPGPWRAVFDLAALDGAPLRLRNPQPGDRVRPVGLGGSKKLQDVFVDAKVPRAERSSWLVLEVGGVVLWVPGLARAEQATVTPATRRVLVVEARREPR
jgi:tRNA(Ile)-lysidine synthase